ncbi:MAG: putative transcriptional regulator [Rickettsiales bacterium]|jgi:transcriptional regulator with XRE-family HTH domain|nr:putative transcriptional regulator [Rickettsiales bacterium]
MALHPVDIHVGKRLRSRRVMLGMSQESLGNGVGVTFQQIQKYEKGLNRVGASRLYEFSRVLEVPVAYFYEGLTSLSGRDDMSQAAFAEGSSTFEHEEITNKEVLSLVRAFNEIADPQARKNVVSLVRFLAKTPGVSLSVPQSAGVVKAEAEVD